MGLPLKALLRGTALALLLAWQPLAASATATAVTEYAVKSALLLKLTRFVYLPTEQEDRPRHLCILGQNFFGDTLQQLNQASAPDQQVELVFLSATEQAPGCNYVFISQSERRRLGSILRQLDGLPLVTISDLRGFARNGGMVEFALTNEQGSQLNILINRETASRQGITFNAQLLRLATLVNE